MPNLLEVPAGATIRIARTIGSTAQNEQLGKVGFVPLADVTVEKVSKLQQRLEVTVDGRHRVLTFGAAKLIEFEGPIPEAPAAPEPAPAPAPRFLKPTPAPASAPA
ncbi:MAG: FeoA domain-containing protein, partial [Kiritimatiellae bacterium]|nr:FeoA domain-containing protein [Kiritimatiellia bacterium]